jgi:hypothetical protein
MMSVINFIIANFSQILVAIMALISAVIGICLLIPGEQPEKFLQSLLDFLSKFSRK